MRSADFNGQVSVELEMLAIHTTGHQSQQDRIRTDQGLNRDACFLCCSHQDLSRICNTRTTRFTEYRDLFSKFNLLKKFLFYSFL